MSQAAKNMWNTRFEVQEFVFGESPNEYLSKIAPQYLSPKQKVLCVADGEGRNSVWLAKQGLEVHAFDFSDVAINKARQLAQKHEVQVDFKQSDCQDWDWSASQYDAIAAIFIQFASPSERLDLFQNMIKSLKPGGLIVIQGYTPKQLQYKTGGPSDVAYLYTEELLKDLLVGTQILEMTSYESLMSEGPGHNGMSALVGVVAKKLL
jgi:2-polyprenyl-3-methyl-5-hydroxy-6-metoxy-1,4-benzoquinol methylase